MTKNSKARIFTALPLIFLGVVGRIALSSLPNIEIVTLVVLLGGLLLGGYWAVIVPITVMALSDIWIGNNVIFLFTWSGFALLGASTLFMRKKLEPRYSIRFLSTFTGFGVIGVLLYDVWTAFGWWLLFYPHTTTALLHVALLQVPFTLKHLTSALLTLPTGACVYVWLQRTICRVENRCALPNAIE